jgi:hypothetical protein
LLLVAKISLALARINSFCFRIKNLVNQIVLKDNLLVEVKQENVFRNFGIVMVKSIVLTDLMNLEQKFVVLEFVQLVNSNVQIIIAQDPSKCVTEMMIAGMDPMNKIVINPVILGCLNAKIQANVFQKDLCVMETMTVGISLTSKIQYAKIQNEIVQLKNSVVLIINALQRLLFVMLMMTVETVLMNQRIVQLVKFHVVGQSVPLHTEQSLIGHSVMEPMTAGMEVMKIQADVQLVIQLVNSNVHHKINVFLDVGSAILKTTVGTIAMKQTHLVVELQDLAVNQNLDAMMAVVFHPVKFVMELFNVATD